MLMGMDSGGQGEDSWTPEEAMISTLQRSGHLRGFFRTSGSTPPRKLSLTNQTIQLPFGHQAIPVEPFVGHMAHLGHLGHLVSVHPHDEGSMSSQQMVRSPPLAINHAKSRSVPHSTSQYSPVTRFAAPGQLRASVRTTTTTEATSSPQVTTTTTATTTAHCTPVAEHSPEEHFPQSARERLACAGENRTWGG